MCKQRNGSVMDGLLSLRERADRRYDLYNLEMSCPMPRELDMGLPSIARNWPALLNFVQSTIVSHALRGRAM